MEDASNTSIGSRIQRFQSITAPRPQRIQTTPRHSHSSEYYYPPIKKRAPPQLLLAPSALLYLSQGYTQSCESARSHHAREREGNTNWTEMPSMERSVSLAERGTAYGGGAGADLRSYSASYAPRAPPKPNNNKVSRTRSTAASAWAAQPPVHRSGSVKSVSGGPTPGLNLRSYSASYAASYGPILGATGGGGGGQGQLKRSGSVTNWSASGRRSVNLRGYTPSFAALDDTAAAPPAVPTTTVKKQASVRVVDEAELQRKKRLVVYKVYDVEGKLRSSVRRGVGWIKSRCSRVMYGWW